jgi:hypothetical protein
MAGLVPGHHGFVASKKSKTSMPAISAGMTLRVIGRVER